MCQSIACDVVGLELPVYSPFAFGRFLHPQSRPIEKSQLDRHLFVLVPTLLDFLAKASNLPTDVIAVPTKANTVDHLLRMLAPLASTPVRKPTEEWLDEAVEVRGFRHKH